MPKERPEQVPMPAQEVPDIGIGGLANLENRISFERFLVHYKVVTATESNGAVISPFLLSPYGTLAGQTGEIRFLELSANGISYVGLKAPDSITKDVVWTLPAKDGERNDVLVTDGRAILGFKNVLDILPNPLRLNGPWIMQQNGDMVTWSHTGTDFYTKISDGKYIFQTDEGVNTDTILEIRGKGTGKGVLKIYNVADYVTMYHTGTDPYMKWNDGIFWFQTDEGTNTKTKVGLKGKGNLGSVFYFYGPNDDYATWQKGNMWFAVESGQVSGDVLILNPNNNNNVEFFTALGTTTNPEVRIAGYITAGSALRYTALKMDNVNDEFLIRAESNANHEGITIDLPRSDQKFRLRQNSDTMSWYLSTTNAYQRWSDGALIFQTDEATNTNTIVGILGKGTGLGRLGIETISPEGSIDLIGPAAGELTTLGSETFGLIIQQRLSNDLADGFGPNISFWTSNDQSDTWQVCAIEATSTFNESIQTGYAGKLRFYTTPGGTTNPSGRRTKGASLIERVTIDEVGNLSLTTSNTELRFYEGENYVGFEAPALSANKIWVLPNADGPANEAWSTDGSGNIIWRTHDELAGFESGEHFTMLDEDDMATNSNTQAATQQSIKAYAIRDTADIIKDGHIDWGIGANQISAVDLPIADSMSLFAATEVETALEEVMDMITIVTHTADTVTMTVDQGSTGTVAYTRTLNDGNEFAIDEISGPPNPNWIADFDFSGITSGHEPNLIEIHWSYNGGHDIHLAMWNYTGTPQWDDIDTTTFYNSSGTLMFDTIEIPGTITDYTSGGVARLRLYHDGNGVAADDFVIDYLAIKDDHGIGSGITDHGAMSGLGDNDHGAIYYTETEVDTWRNSVSQAEMGYLNGVSSDVQTQIGARTTKTTAAWNKSIGATGDYATWAAMIADMPDQIAHAVTVTIEAGTTLTEICELKNKHGVTKDGEITIQAERYYPISGDIPTADSATATTLRDAALAAEGFGNDYFNDCWIFIVHGTGTDNGFVKITDYVDATGDVVVANWPGTQPDGTSRYIIVGALIYGGGIRNGLEIQYNTVPISGIRGIGIYNASLFGIYLRYCFFVGLFSCGVYDSNRSGVYATQCNSITILRSGFVKNNTVNNINYGGLAFFDVGGGYFSFCGISDNNQRGVYVSNGSFVELFNSFGDGNGDWGGYAKFSGQLRLLGTECSGAIGNHSDPGTAGNANADQAAAYV